MTSTQQQHQITNNNDAKQYDDLFKIVIIGDSGVGKSCLLLRFADDTFTDNYYTTIGVDFINNKKVKLQIWDTAGQERFKTVTSAYYRGADGIVIVYDQTDLQSFEHLNNWLDDIAKYTTDAPVKVVLANKDDLKERRIVTEEQIKNFSQSSGIEVIKTSAKNSFQVKYAFEKLTQKLISQRERKEMIKGYSLEPTPIEGRFTRRNCCSY